MHIGLFMTPVPLGRLNVEGKTVVVVDVLRMTTSVCAMFESGAKSVIPVSGPGEATELWSKLGPDSAVLAGERDGKRIENFQLGNSPAEFTPEKVAGRIVVTTTTNGAAVFKQVVGAKLVLPCAFVNISAVAARVAREESDLVVACSGGEGSYSVEDTLCGGMLIDKLLTEYGVKADLNDAGRLAHMLFERNRDRIAEAVAEGEHGRFLTSIGFGDDITLAARIDAIPIVSVLKDGRLVPAPDQN